jgi:hypothetical protein
MVAQGHRDGNSSGAAALCLFPTNTHILLDFAGWLRQTDRSRREEAS